MWVSFFSITFCYLALTYFANGFSHSSSCHITFLPLSCAHFHTIRCQLYCAYCFPPVLFTFSLSYFSLPHPSAILPFQKLTKPFPCGIVKVSYHHLLTSKMAPATVARRFRCKTIARCISIGYWLVSLDSSIIIRQLLCREAHLATLKELLNVICANVKESN